MDFARDGLGLRTAVIVGTGVGGETTQDEQSRRLYGENAQRAHPLTIVRLMTNASASQISIALGSARRRLRSSQRLRLGQPRDQPGRAA